jgi:aspartate/methionine/tyrosine aminotransferase
MSLLASRLTALGTENAFKLGADIQRCLDRGKDVVRFNLGEPDFDTAPHINRVAIAEIEAGNAHYCDPAGIRPFRESIARHISVTRDLEVDPDRVVVTPGAKPPISFTFQSYVDSGDEVIYPSPGFPIYESWVTFVGAKPVPLMLSEERGFAFTPGDLEALVTERTKLIIFNSPSNPTGGVLSKDTLEGLAAVIRKNCRTDVRIYSDEVYEHILFDGEKHHSIATPEGMADRTVPTREEAEIFKQLNINIVSCVPPFIQEAGRAAYEDPESAKSVGRMVEEFERRRDWVVPALNRIEGIGCQTPKGAFYVFPNVAGVCERLKIFEAYDNLPTEARGKTTPAGMLQMFLLYGYGVATMDRNSFGSIGAEGQHFLRLSIATGMDQLKEGVRRIEEAAGDREGFERFLDKERLWD